MINMTQEEKSFLENCIDPEVVKNGNTRDVLTALYLVIDQKGFDEEYFYNDFGKKAQEVYDSIFEKN